MLSVKARFLKYVLRASDYGNGCWPWVGATVQSGAGPVGRFKFEGRSQWAPRVAYQLYKGPIPHRRVIRHKCDNPLCVRPAHLIVGTHKQNARDKVERNRVGRGGTGPKLDAFTRRWVCERLKSGHSTIEIARFFGVSRQAISYYARKMQ